MPDNFTLYLLLLAALAIGFVLGRRELRRSAPERLERLERVFERGHDTRGPPRDAAMDSVLEAAVASQDGIDTRLALGALVRRRGEVDRAIRIHQALLARPALRGAERARIELELARDYLAAGLLGRAENLLLTLAEKGGSDKLTAQRLLLEIYQREREWARAVEVGRAVARHDRSVRGQLAHFQCELAEAALAQGDLRLARQELARGSDFDPGCARIGLVRAAVELAAGRYRDVRKHLQRALAQDPDCAHQALTLYRRACEAGGDEAGYRAFLEECLERNPSVVVVRELAACLARSDGNGRAAQFVADRLQDRPTLAGFAALLDHLDQDGQPLPPEQLELLRRFTGALVEAQPAYRCQNCGFGSRARMWQCPSCHEWGSEKSEI